MKSIYSVRCSEHYAAQCDVMEYVGCGDRQTYLITRVLVPSGFRGRGIGKLLMDKVLADADDEQVSLCLTPQPYLNAQSGLSRRALKEWYERLGFAPKAGPGGSWLRTPKPKPKGE